MEPTPNRDCLRDGRNQRRLGETPIYAQFLMLALGVVAPVISSATNWLAAEQTTGFQSFEGQVVKLADILAKQGVQLDADAVPFTLALRTNEGRLLPIVKTLGSRALFQDSRLLNRAVQVQGRMVPEAGVLVVHRFYTLKNAEPHEVYYWCETCAIRRDYPDKGVCECCGGPMELKEVPLKH